LPLRSYLPQAVGHDILIERHDGVPIVDLSVLEKYFPGTSRGLRAADGAVAIGDAKIVFVDFSKLLGSWRSKLRGAHALLRQTDVLRPVVSELVSGHSAPQLNNRSWLRLLPG